jgi:hypothetical protein
VRARDGAPDICVSCYPGGAAILAQVASGTLPPRDEGIARTGRFSATSTT